MKAGRLRQFFFEDADCSVVSRFVSAHLLSMVSFCVASMPPAQPPDAGISMPLTYKAATFVTSLHCFSNTVSDVPDAELYEGPAYVQRKYPPAVLQRPVIVRCTTAQHRFRSNLCCTVVVAEENQSATAVHLHAGRKELAESSVRALLSY
jgi:hypothetical protein